jgi:hypothetical protein
MVRLYQLLVHQLRMVVVAEVEYILTLLLVLLVVLAEAEVQVVE